MNKKLANIGIGFPLVALFLDHLAKGSSNKEKNTVLYDSTGKVYIIRYEFIPMDLIVASNKTNFQKNENYPKEFQARDLSAGPQTAKIRLIEAKMDLLRIIAPSLDPTIGAPVVWKDGDRYFVLAGNSRTIAFQRLMNGEHRTSRMMTYRGLVRSYFPELETNNNGILVRVVKNISFAEAVQLAGASQQSTAGVETPLRRGLSAFRSWSVDMSSVPAIDTPMPITRDTVGKFIRGNPAFWTWITNTIPPMLSTQMFNETTDVSIKLDVLNSMLIGLYLPSSVIEDGFNNLSEENVIMMMLPYIGAIHQAVLRGDVHDYYDLYPYWMTAREFTSITRGKGYKEALQYYQNRCDKNQLKLFKYTDTLCEMPKLGVALSFFIKHASNLVNPISSIRRLGDFLDEIRKKNPRQLQLMRQYKNPKQLQDDAYSLFIETVLPNKVTNVLGGLK